MQSVKVGVIAGTPIDTAMGVKLVEKAGFEAIGSPVARSPEEETTYELFYKKHLTNLMLQKIERLKSKGVKLILIYCNSLSVAIDLEWVQEQAGVTVVTPLDVYRRTAQIYTKIGLLAANCQSVGGIEKVFCESNPELVVIGTGVLPVVKAVEAGKPPAQIVNHLGVRDMLNGMLGMGAEAIVLGCTHFSYFARELEAICSIPVCDPSVEIIALLAGMAQD